MANLNVNVIDGNNLNVNVTPVAKQVIQINRGVAGAPSNTIAGFPVVMSNIQRRDVIMFGNNEWNNVGQTEITDGGNF